MTGVQTCALPILTTPEVEEKILLMEKDERVRYAVADPSIFIRNGGPSIAENMPKCKWRRGDNKRKPGWEQLRNRLVGEIINGVETPMIYFGDDCEDSIRTIPTLQHDETDTEDLDTDGEDHAADETRYAVMSRPWNPAPPIVVESGLQMPKHPSQMTFQELVSANTRKRQAQSW